MNPQDRTILRDLGRRVAEIAALPVQQETIACWKALNGLKPVRPMCTIDQVPWHEMDVDGELTLRCQDPFFKKIETQLRRTLYRWNHMRADMVVAPFIDLPKVVANDGMGYERVENLSTLDPKNDVVGHYYLDQIKTDADVEKIHKPNLKLDEKATAANQARAQEVFDGLLGVRMEGWIPAFCPWDVVVQWHGVENTLYDLVDRPDFMHHLVAKLTQVHLAMLDDLEALGLLAYPQALVHCTGAWSDEIPAAGFDPARPRAKDSWTFGMAQIFGAVSPAMFQEFEVDYTVRWYARFGLGYYGCCEPLHDKIDLIRKIPNVRKVSMSPWADVEKGAEGLGRDYVFSRKPSPALLAVDDWSTAAVEKDLKKTLDACARHGCPVELILKDISTVRYEPRRLWDWSDVARRLVQ